MNDSYNAGLSPATFGKYFQSSIVKMSLVYSLKLLLLDPSAKYTVITVSSSQL